MARHAEAGVHQLAIDFAAEGRFGQASANRSSDFCHCDWAGKLTQRTVGKSDLNHVSTSKKRGKGHAWRKYQNVRHAFYAALAHIAPNPLRCRGGQATPLNLA
jgi:hypothetical protein